MTLTIQLPPESESRLLEKARLAGVDIPTYLGRVLERDALLPNGSDLAESLDGKGRSRSAWPIHYIEQTYGCLSDDPMDIPEDPVPLPEGIE